MMYRKHIALVRENRKLKKEVKRLTVKLQHQTELTEQLMSVMNEKGGVNGNI